MQTICCFQFNFQKYSINDNEQQLKKVYNVNDRKHFQHMKYLQSYRIFNINTKNAVSQIYSFTPFLPYAIQNIWSGNTPFWSLSVWNDDGDFFGSSGAKFESPTVSAFYYIL